MNILYLEFSSKSSILEPMNSVVEFLNVRNVEELKLNQEIMKFWKEHLLITKVLVWAVVELGFSHDPRTPKLLSIEFLH